jgi:hypothetical protein
MPITGELFVGKMIWLGWRTNAAVPFPPIHFGVHVHFVAVKIGVIRLCHRHIEPERVPFFMIFAI